MQNRYLEKFKFFEIDNFFSNIC